MSLLAANYSGPSNRPQLGRAFACIKQKIIKVAAEILGGICNPLNAFWIPDGLSRPLPIQNSLRSRSNRAVRGPDQKQTDSPLSALAAKFTTPEERVNTKQAAVETTWSGWVARLPSVFSL